MREVGWGGGGVSEGDREEGRTDGRTDGQTDRGTEGRRDGVIEGGRKKVEETRLPPARSSGAMKAGVPTCGTASALDAALCLCLVSLSRPSPFFAMKTVCVLRHRSFRFPASPSCVCAPLFLSLSLFCPWQLLVIETASRFSVPAARRRQTQAFARAPHSMARCACTHW